MQKYEVFPPLKRGATA